jgi:hypothetical protein
MSSLVQHSDKEQALWISFIHTTSSNLDGVTKDPKLKRCDIESDYRFQLIPSLQAFLNINQVTWIDLDIPTEDIHIRINEIVRSDFIQLLPASSSSSGQVVHIYFSSFVDDLRLVTKALSLLLEAFKSSDNIVFNWTFLEDLIYIPRPYIYLNNLQRNFFRKLVSSVKEQCDQLHINTNRIRLCSSNELRNRWGEGDCFIIPVPQMTELGAAEDMWRRVLSEVQFSEMFNQGNAVPRLIAIEHCPPEHQESFLIPSEFESQGVRLCQIHPLYRHPNDQEPDNLPMPVITQSLLSYVNQATGITGINHVLIQHYRDGRDNIAQHSDKTLDICPETPILNLSLGAPRDLFLQNKTDKNRLERIPLRHGECLVFGLETNRCWYHEIPKRVDEPAYVDWKEMSYPNDDWHGGGRISFTFRKIKTFICQIDLGATVSDGNRFVEVIIGQGSPYKTIADYLSSQGSDDVAEFGGKHLSSDRTELIAAFSKENRQGDEFNWQEHYGEGFLCR